MKPTALLRDAIARSGRSVSGWATEVVMRDPRTVRRWLAGTSPIPPVVLDFLKREAAKP